MLRFAAYVIVTSFPVVLAFSFFPLARVAAVMIFIAILCTPLLWGVSSFIATRPMVFYFLPYPKNVLRWPFMAILTAIPALPFYVVGLEEFLCLWFIWIALALWYSAFLWLLDRCSPLAFWRGIPAAYRRLILAFVALCFFFYVWHIHIVPWWYGFHPYFS